MTARTSIVSRLAVLLAAVAVLAALLVVYSQPDPPRVDLAGNPFAGVNVKLYCVDRPWPLGWTCWRLPT